VSSLAQSRATLVRLEQRTEEAASIAEEAQRLYERKGNVIAARGLQPIVDALHATAPM